MNVLTIQSFAFKLRSLTTMPHHSGFVKIKQLISAFTSWNTHQFIDFEFWGVEFEDICPLIHGLNGKLKRQLQKWAHRQH